MKKMVDMARSAKELKTTGDMAISSPSREKYPYGLSISLDSEGLKKLGIKDLPEVGDEVNIMAVARVVSTSQNASESNDSTRVELQITQMCAEIEPEEADDKPETADEENAEVYGGKIGVRFK